MHQARFAGTRWDPGQYSRFADHRLRPALDLLARVPLAAPSLIYDLGCGTGEVTRLLADRWPDAAVIGLDNSPDMLAKAQNQPSRVQWIEADIATWRPVTPPDLIYANATLQWLDQHDTLIPRLFASLAPGGCLAIQMPQSWPLPSHRLMRETLADVGPNRTPLGSPALRQALEHVWVGPPDRYYDLLAPHTDAIDIWETEYLQTLHGADPVLEWVRGTGLRPVLASLSDAERAVFLSSYADRLRVAYPARADGSTLYPFRRLFIVALRPVA